MSELERTRQRTAVGRVVSNKMDKTIVVLVERRVPHKMYKKILTRSQKYHAHDPANECTIGDMVKIGETKPMAKTKAWELLEVMEKAQ
jgi:small subunit ribosomal protein S17